MYYLKYGNKHSESDMSSLRAQLLCLPEFFPNYPGATSPDFPSARSRCTAGNCFSRYDNIRQVSHIKPRLNLLRLMGVFTIFFYVEHMFNPPVSKGLINFWPKIFAKN